MARKLTHPNRRIGMAMKRQLHLALASLVTAGFASSAFAAPIDISASFNGDGLAVDTNDNAGDAFFGASQWKFRTDESSSPAFPASGGTFTSQGGGPDFTFGSYAGDDMVKIDGQGSVEINIADQQIDTLYALHTAIGLSVATNGTFTFNYVGGSSSTALVWDVRDSDGNHGSEPVALADATIERMNDNVTSSSRDLFYATFVNPNQGLVVESVTFSTVGVNDSNADYGIFALDAVPVPEPGSLTLMGLGGLCVLRRRRS